MKKAILVKILSLIIQISPPVYILVTKFPLVVDRPEVSISLFSIFVIIFVLLAFKDLGKKILKLPGGFGFVLFSFVFSIIGMFLGQYLALLSGVALASSLLAYPFTIWYNYLTRPVTANDLVESLKEVFNK